MIMSNPTTEAAINVVILCCSTAPESAVGAGVELAIAGVGAGAGIVVAGAGIGAVQLSRNAPTSIDGGTSTDSTT